ncbi:MAG TPA: hypothetical protein ENF63_01930 [Candidatus Bathyarchaeota archaeon]|nr:hypothetical protein [Candidatus Bathyarchaeota archaeon]
MLREAWTLAIEALSWMELEGLNEKLALARASKQLEVKDVNALRLAHKMVLETTRKRNLIDYILNKVLRPHLIGEFKLGVRQFLRLYTHEIHFGKAKFEEAIEMVKTGRAILGWRELHNLEYVFGEIFNFNLKENIKELNDEEKISLLTYNPRWFVRYCFRVFGRNEALKILESGMKSPPTYIRLNTLKGTEKKILKSLATDGIRLKKIEGLRYTYRVLSTEKPLNRTKSFAEGLFYIQDLASCLAAEVADPKPNMTVLDVCAAPGAKTSFMAQLMENRGLICSIDYSRRRMNVWKNEIKRMGVKIAKPIIADACNPLPLNAEVDLVVLDPPCTSTGAFAKLPSAKWRLNKRSPFKMAEIQWKMLLNCAEKMKPGGCLIYSTCSICLEENELLIERFIRLFPEFKLVKAEPWIGNPGLRGLTKCQRLYPHLHNCNGFFVAKLIRET